MLDGSRGPVPDAAMNRKVKRICVYCGSGSGLNPAYAQAARDLGDALARADIGLVYGGGGLGLMGEVARSVLSAGGHVTGIIPDFLFGTEHAFEDVQELVVTGSMAERKNLMYEKADAFIALPGGVGTLEEFMEQLTLSQIGVHNKPIVLVNMEGYWDILVQLFTHMRESKFIHDGYELKFETVGNVTDAVSLILQQTKSDRAITC